MTLPSNKVVSYGYDSYLMDEIQVGTTTVLDAAEYQGFGPIKSWTWGNNSSHSRTYTTRGNIWTKTVAGDTQSYSFFVTGELYSVDDGRQQTGFTYQDLVSSTQTFNSTIDTTTPSNQLVDVSDPSLRSYSYDSSGNTTADGRHTYGYDDRGRLVTVDSGTTATYVHNGLGERVKKTTTGGTNLFVYDDFGHLVGEYTSTGALVQEHVWFNNEPVALLQGSDIYYVHTDHLGTPRVVTDGSTEIWRWESGPFGLNLPDEDPDGNSVDLQYSLRLPGQYFDSETQLHYNYFRTYDPSVGRYLESDPIGLGGGINTYSYAAQNPLTYSDSRGLLLDQVKLDTLMQCAKTGTRVVVTTATAVASGAVLLLTPTPGAKCDQPFPPPENNCPIDDDCARLIAKIKQHIEAMRREYLRLTIDKHNLFRLAFNTNPGGDLAGLGTWTGHIVRYRGLMKGLTNMVNEAMKKGCPLPNDVLEWETKQPPESPTSNLTPKPRPK